MLRFAFILALIWSSYCNGIAQTSYTVRGVIRDTAGMALPRATVRVVTKKDSITSISKEDGSFVFSDLGSRQMELIVSMKGYITAHRELSIKQGVRFVDVDPILLSVDYTNLDSVVIRRVRPVIIGLDTITYQAAAFKVRDGSEVEALLKKLPGLEVDMNGNVIVQGKKIGRVRVDGKDFFGGDVLTATRNLPADIVDKIQVIDDYGDKARLTGIKSGDAMKILNIVLKADKRTGKFGRLQVNDGNENKYAGNTFANFFKNERQFSINGSLDNSSPSGNTHAKILSLHYANRWNKKWLGETNVSLSGTNPSSSGSTIQDNYYVNGQLHQEQSNRANGNNHVGSFGSTITYTPDAYHTMRIRPSLNFQQSRQIVSSTLSTIQQDSGFTKTTDGNVRSQTNNNVMGAQADIYYEQLFPHSKKRFNVQASIQYTNNRSQNDNLTNTLTQVDGLSGRSVLHYLIDNAGSNWRTNANANYFSPLGKASFLEFAYTWVNSYMQNSKFSRQPDSTGDRWIKIDSLSNNYFFQSITHRFHMGYSAQINKLGVSLSLDGQPGSMRGTIAGKVDAAIYNYFSILPGVQGNWIFASGHTLSFQYSGNPELPSLQQLQPSTDRSNPQYPVTGNPSLKPAFTQNINLSYEHAGLKPTQFQGFGIALSYIGTQHAIMQNIVRPKDTGSVIQEITYLNAGGLSSYNLNYHLNPPFLFNKRFRIVISGNITFSNTDAMTDDILYTTHTRVWGQALHFQYILPDILESEVTGNYSNSLTRYPAGGTAPVSFSTVDWSLSNRHILWGKWILNYNFSQGFNSGASGRLIPRQSFLAASLQRQLLPKNKITLSLIGNDLLNSNTGISQSVSPTNITKSQTNLIGRYFMISLLWKWGKF